MASLRRAIRRFGSVNALQPISADVAPSPTVPAEAPRLNLPHVETQLNMHQFNGLFEDGTPAADGLRGRFRIHAIAMRNLLTPIRPSTDSHGSPSQPSHPSNLFNLPNPSNPSNLPTSPTLNGVADETPTEWSAVGHAATGKSGRVIHNLQEEIARLRRECGVYRSRAEETQRSNDTLKTQVQNMSERLRNLEQVNETNLNSIARKDRKIEELRNELQNERDKRKEAEASASKVNDMMRDERENHHREQAESHEQAKYHSTQYDVLVGATKREKAELSRRVKNLCDELITLKQAHEKHVVSTGRLDAIADQKNREIESLKDMNERLMTSHVEYKQMKDDELRETIEKAHANDALIEAALAQIRKTEEEMKWAIRLNESRVKEKEGEK
ncbi:hypothetical protein N7532_010067 [Penicillium argentinense]|uniref:SWI5-dependent HO expression protein 3 n=1 Tax=Penicillium argentinense TaxID=1131581 RepID=A0A9W9ENZ0_9EURO|nr:uncharacterized protein N7532_010067 [Penicillium argentinense]KAJ5085296.1 hypothetical protein N7532_010067 [Penicillium argentinense]